MTKPAAISARERHILTLLYPDKTLAIGLSVCADLYRRGMIDIDRRRWRYVLTAKGRELIAQKEMEL
jgi:hypothetical protein